MFTGQLVCEPLCCVGKASLSCGTTRCSQAQRIHNDKNGCDIVDLVEEFFEF